MMLCCCCAAMEVNIKVHAQRRVRGGRPSNTASSNNTSRLLSASWRLARVSMKRSLRVTASGGKKAFSRITRCNDVVIRTRIALEVTTLVPR
jgi:hypothetical protein